VSTLQERVNDYLRIQSPGVQFQVAETERSEYLLRRAEIELSRAQERLDKIKQQIECDGSSESS